jgi:ketosteroid isomerase-like protein
VTHPNAALIDRFYTAFAKRDAATMASCYHADVEFSDPVFPALRGADAGKMWTMLCARAADLRVEHKAVVADERTGSAHWDAYYTFSATGRKVHNSIDATFDFKDGLIVRHVDRFGFYRWARQALGPTGLVLGWTPLVKNKVRRTAAKGLADWKV